MTCPIDSLEDFYTNHWDTDTLCFLMSCQKCTAEAGEGALWWMADSPPDKSSLETKVNDDIPF